MANKSRVLFINNEGGGFADYVEVEEGTTMVQLFNAQLPDADPKSYLIRINREVCSADQVLKNNDRVSCTPTKMDGQSL